METETKGQLEFTLEPRKVREIKLMTADDLYSDIGKISVIDMQESPRVECKVVGIQARALGEYFSVFANTPPDGGIILVGVTDDGAIEGCKRTSTSHLNELERAGDIYCPDTRYGTRRIKVTNQKGEPDIIVALRVHYRTDKLVETTDGTAWIRRGSSKKKLTDDLEKRELRDSKGQVDVELEPVALQFPDDFKMDLVRQFFEAVRQQRRMPPSMSTEEVLLLRHLGKHVADKFQPNLACGLLFAKDIQKVTPGCRIRFFRYNGNLEKTGEQYNVIKSEWIEGTVPELIVNAEWVIDSQLREFQRLGKDNKFYAIPEYPKPAWYEAIVTPAFIDPMQCGI
jgi:ATP-dependent DNA helicase RecG